MNKCQQCGEPAQTTLCKTCAKHMRRQASSLAKTIPELRALAERKAHIGEVQSSIWDEHTRRVFEESGITLL